MTSSAAATGDAIARGRADVLAGRVTPHPSVTRAAPVPVDARAVVEACRAVVWSRAARDAYVALLTTLDESDPDEARRLAEAIDRIAEDLGRVPVGVEGRVPFTWEKAIPSRPYLLIFELVTWTKAGEVIAIDALVNESGSVGKEAPLF